MGLSFGFARPFFCPRDRFFPRDPLVVPSFVPGCLRSCCLRERRALADAVPGFSGPRTAFDGTPRACPSRRPSSEIFWPPDCLRRRNDGSARANIRVPRFSGSRTAFDPRASSGYARASPSSEIFWLPDCLRLRGEESLPQRRVRSEIFWLPDCLRPLFIFLLMTPSPSSEIFWLPDCLRRGRPP